jgi:hypothetical protein
MDEGLQGICPHCSLQGENCPYDFLHPPSFPCKYFMPFIKRRTFSDRKPSTAAQREKWRKQYALNRDKKKLYYRRNKESRKAYQQMYRELNREAIRLKDKAYRQSKKEGGGS